MRIIICSINYAPDLIGIAKYTTEMAECFAGNGHQVHVITAHPYYPEWKHKSPKHGRYLREQHNGVTVWRCPIYVPTKPTSIKRLLHLLSFAVSSFPIILSQIFRRPHLVITIEPPLFTATTAWLVARLSQATAWLHIQDFEIDAAIQLKLISKRWGRIALFFEKFLLQRFDRVSTISQNMLRRIKYKGVESSRCYYFPNWVDTQQIKPLSSSNSFREALGFSSRDIVCLYSGNMAAKQGIEILIDAAAQLQSHKNIQFVLCGDGPARVTLTSRAAQVKNIHFLPLQPMDKLNELLNMADIHLLPQSAQAEDLVMPSKLAGMLASGRPVIATANAGTKLAEVVAQTGLVVPPGNVIELTEAIKQFAAESEIRTHIGQKAREYALTHFCKTKILSRVLMEHPF